MTIIQRIFLSDLFIEYMAVNTFLDAKDTTGNKRDKNSGFIALTLNWERQRSKQIHVSQVVIVL